MCGALLWTPPNNKQHRWASPGATEHVQGLHQHFIISVPRWVTGTSSGAMLSTAASWNRVFLLWITIPSTCSLCKFGSAATKRALNAATMPAWLVWCENSTCAWPETLLSDELKGQLTHLCSACGCCTEGSVGRSLHLQVAANDESFNKMSQKTWNNTRHQQEVWSYAHLIMSQGGKLGGVSL